MESTPLTAVWRLLSESVFQEMEAWRKQHPRATFKEIEDEVDGRLSGVRAQMLADVAQQSEQRPHCPTCGSPLQARGKHERRLATQGGKTGQPLTELWNLPAVCKRVFSPSMRSWSFQQPA